MIVLVTGPEFNGTRMMCRMVQEAGGQYLHQPVPLCGFNPSYPDGVWPDFSKSGWDKAVVMVRDPYCAARAQMSVGLVKNEEESYVRRRRALVHIFSELAEANKPFWATSYESLRDHRAVLALFVALGLPGEEVQTRCQDANTKHYGGYHWADHRRLQDGRVPVQHPAWCRSRVCVEAGA